MSANDRIQWLHKKISDNSYPGIPHIIEQFSISRRQAQRDIDYLRNTLGAPVAYSAAHKGYYYTKDFSFPFMNMSESDTDFNDAIHSLRAFYNACADGASIQLMLPYSATLEISNRMTVLNLRPIIVKDEPHNRYKCEFTSVELFIGMIMSCGADVKIIEPEWLKNRVINFAKNCSKTMNEFKK